MTNNGFLLVSKRREIKISVVSSVRETDTKRRDFSIYIIVQCYKNETIHIFLKRCFFQLSSHPAGLNGREWSNWSRIQSDMDRPATQSDPTLGPADNRPSQCGYSADGQCG